MKLLHEFKEFALRGNVLDLAVGVIIGTEFGKIVNSLVNDVIMPPIGMLIGNDSFSNLGIVLQEKSVDAAGKEIPMVALKYGAFLQTSLNFIIIAFSVFMVVKAMNTLKRLRDEKAAREEVPAAPPAPSKEEVLLTEIRDLLKK